MKEVITETAFDRIVEVIPYDGMPHWHFAEALKIALAKLTPEQQEEVVEEWRKHPKD
jgi:hypothetical protein